VAGEPGKSGTGSTVAVVWELLRMKQFVFDTGFYMTLLQGVITTSGVMSRPRKAMFVWRGLHTWVGMECLAFMHLHEYSKHVRIFFASLSAGRGFTRNMMEAVARSNSKCHFFTAHFY
jgi:hypothetical protein